MGRLPLHQEGEAGIMTAADHPHQDIKNHLHQGTMTPHQADTKNHLHQGTTTKTEMIIIIVDRQSRVTESRSEEFRDHHIVEKKRRKKLEDHIGIRTASKWNLWKRRRNPEGG